MIDDHRVHIFTDGACKGNPGPGGWGAWLIYQHHEKELCGGELLTTNNRMELQAVIEALGSLTRSCDVIITVDSKYVMDGSMKWLPTWKKNGWHKKGGIKNIELWKQLDILLSKHTVEWQWVRGHTGHLGNERSDQLANRGLRENLKKH